LGVSPGIAETERLKSLCLDELKRSEGFLVGGFDDGWAVKGHGILRGVERKLGLQADSVTKLESSDECTLVRRLRSLVFV